jgi:hypothetical protein
MLHDAMNTSSAVSETAMASLIRTFKWVSPGRVRARWTDPRQSLRCYFGSSMAVKRVYLGG